MKQQLYILSLLIIFFSCKQKPQDAGTLEVTWYFPVRCESLDKLPWKLLDAIDERKIKTYDTAWHEISREEVEAKITLDMRDVYLTPEECNIMMANGDYSFGEYLEPTLTVEQIKQLEEKEQSIDSLMKHRPAFESKVFQFELVEKVKLDTTLRRQKGEMQYIRLIIPAEYTASKHPELLCQVKYEDFKKLAIPEEKMIDQHEFMCTSGLFDLRIDDGEEVLYLSSFRDPKTRNLKADELRNSIFKYFGKDIWLMDFTSTDKDVPIYPLQDSLYK